MFKRGLFVLAACVSAAAAFTTSASAGDTLTGAGSTFVSPLVSVWGADYEAKTGVHITYGAIGSGGGIAQITARTVDFGASDAPLSPDQFAACNGCVQIPWALSATSIVYNLDGVPNDLHMTGPVLAKIYLGQITKWNDPAIKALNPNAKLPDQNITPVYRSDGSGTSYNFTDYLSAVSSNWRSKIGRGTSVAWPAGIGAKGSSGVTGTVANTKGALTYVDVAFALRNHLKFMAMQNASGFFALPGLRGINAAAATIKKIPANNEMHIVNPPKGDRLAYPICTFTYVILPVKTSKASLLRRFIFYAVSPTQGQKLGPKLLFAPLPKVVLFAAEKTLQKVHS